MPLIWAMSNSDSIPGDRYMNLLSRQETVSETVSTHRALECPTGAG